MKVKDIFDLFIIEKIDNDIVTIFYDKDGKKIDFDKNGNSYKKETWKEFLEKTIKNFSISIEDKYNEEDDFDEEVILIKIVLEQEKK